jgi:hypothetical protein
MQIDRSLDEASFWPQTIRRELHHDFQKRRNLAPDLEIGNKNYEGECFLRRTTAAARLSSPNVRCVNGKEMSGENFLIELRFKFCDATA